MKPRILLMFLLTAATLCAQADDITVGGTKRTYYKYIPKDLGENRPLLISMHGMNQDANYQKGMLQIESVADTAKFAVVFPEGIDRSWDIGGTRDINFVLAIIKDMEKNYAIDADRVYLSGFSMGGMFTYHAINHIADKIAAFAPISGYPMGGQPFTSSRPVPIIHTHGTSDDVVNFGGVQRSIDGWIERNNCCKTPEVIQPYRAWHATKHIWGPGEEGCEVVLLELADKGHWIANDYFKTGEEIWNFCKRYSLHQDVPNIKIVSPTEGYEVIGVGNPKNMPVNFIAEVTSPISEIATVDYYIDDNLVGSSQSAPWEYTWTDAKSGTYSVTVRATDARGVSAARTLRPIQAKRARNKYDLSARFTADNIVPAGWIFNNGRTKRVGPLQDVSGGSRVLKFTGEQRDMDYGLLITNTSGGEGAAYASFGEPGTNVSIALAAANFRLTCKVCNWEATSAVTCQVVNLETGAVLGETTVVPTAIIGGDVKNSFSGSTDVALDFNVPEECPVKVVFMPGSEKKNDAVVGDIVITKTGESAVTAIQAGATVVAVEYYDLTGRRCAPSTKGVVVRRTHYSDGIVKSEKTLLR